MHSIPGFIVAALYFQLFSPIFLHARAGGYREQQKPIGAKSYRIQVKETYGAAKDVTLPYAELATRLFSYAGVSVDASGNAESAGNVGITANGTALGANYFGGNSGVYRFTGAVIDGEIRISLAEGSPLVRRFSATRKLDSSVVSVGNNIGSNEPRDAPFRQALSLPNGFLHTVLSILLDLYGPEPVIRALADPDAGVREMAVIALVPSHDPRTVDLLIGVLQKDESNDVRKRCALSLGELGDPRALDAVAAAMRDRRIWDGWDVGGALGKLASVGGKQALLANALHENPAIRSKAIEELGKMKDPADSDIFYAALHDPDGSVRRNAVQVIGNLKDPRSLDALLPLLHDSETGVRYETVMSLRGLGDRRASTPLIEVLSKDKDAWVRSTAAGALGGFGDETGVDPLIEALRDKGPDVRKSAVAALGKIGSPRGIKPLLSTLTDADKSVREEVPTALDDFRNVEAVPGLIEAMKYPDQKVREAILMALVQINDPRAFDSYVGALQDSNCLVREQAAIGLGNLKDRRAVDPLVRALEDRCSGGQQMAVDALGALKDPRAVEPLIRTFETIMSGASFKVSQALSSITGKDLGSDAAKWRNWWSKNHKRFGL